MLIIKKSTVHLKSQRSIIDSQDMPGLLNGLLVGEFICDRILKVPYANGSYEITDQVLRESCLDQSNLLSYGKGATLYAWHISELIVYEQPLPISSLLKACYEPREYCQACKYRRDTFPSDVETTTNLEGRSFDVYCTNFLKRAPQSWCYSRTK